MPPARPAARCCATERARRSRSIPAGSRRRLKNQISDRKRAPETEPVCECAATYGKKPDPTAKHSGQAAGALDIKMQALVQVARQHGEDGVVREPLEKLADVGDPEGTLEPGANFLQAFGESSRVAPCSRRACPERSRRDSGATDRFCVLLRPRVRRHESLFRGWSGRRQW